MDKQLVFVYGTLKQAYGNHGWLHGSELVGEFSTQDNYLLVGVGFPYAIREQDVDDKYKHLVRPVIGELYLCTPEVITESLDLLEGNGHHYQRRQVPLSNGSLAWMYHALREDGTNRRLCSVTEEGYFQWP